MKSGVCMEEQSKCPESKQTVFYPVARCNLNDKICLLESGNKCSYYEEYLEQLKKETEDVKEQKPGLLSERKS